MTTVAEAHAAIKARAIANFFAIPMTFKGDSAALPNTPIAFAFVELLLETSDIIAYGGGRGGNLQRSTGRIEAQILMPTGSGAVGYALGLGYGETFAAVFRGQRTASPDISYFAAEVFPENGRSEDGTSDHVATVTIDLWFDKTA